MTTPSTLQSLQLAVAKMLPDKINIQAHYNGSYLFLWLPVTEPLNARIKELERDKTST